MIENVDGQTDGPMMAGRTTYFGRGYQEEQFCDIILNLGQWFRSRCLLKDFLSGALVTLPVQWSRSIYAILKMNIMGNIHVELN